MKEKTADELFNELGYKKINTPTNFIYQNKKNNKEIRFYKRYKCVEISLIEFEEYEGNSIFFTMQELQAINKKVEELRMGKIVQIPKIICEECKKREATRLCDYEIGHNIDLVGPGKAKRVTCDKKICTKCATKINNKDYCKNHIKALKQEIGGVLSERK